LRTTASIDFRTWNRKYDDHWYDKVINESYHFRVNSSSKLCCCTFNNHWTNVLHCLRRYILFRNQQTLSQKLFLSKISNKHILFQQWLHIITNGYANFNAELWVDFTYTKRSNISRNQSNCVIYTVIYTE